LWEPRDGRRDYLFQLQSIRCSLLTTHLWGTRMGIVVVPFSFKVITHRSLCMDPKDMRLESSTTVVCGEARGGGVGVRELCVDGIS
jgi:hypothetical protein